MASDKLNYHYGNKKLNCTIMRTTMQQSCYIFRQSCLTLPHTILPNPPLQGAAQHAAELTSHPNNFLCCRLWLVWQELTQRMPVFNHSKFLLRRQEGGMSNCQTMLKEMQKSSAKIKTYRLQVQICLPKHWLGVSTRDDLDQTHLKQYSGFSALSLQIHEWASQNVPSLENVTSCSLWIRCAWQHPQACCLMISLTRPDPFKHYGLAILPTKSR